MSNSQAAFTLLQSTGEAVLRLELPRLLKKLSILFGNNNEAAFTLLGPAEMTTARKICLSTAVKLLACKVARSFCCVVYSATSETIFLTIIVDVCSQNS